MLYRYHGENNLKGDGIEKDKGFTYVTNKKFNNEKELRDEAALLKEWGSKIDSISIIKPKKGTYINEGIVGEQKGKFGEVRKGGGYQGLIKNSEISKDTIIKTKKLPKEFFDDKK